MISMTTYTYENTRYVYHANQIRRKMIVLLMYQMTEPCTKITKHDLQSSFLTVGSLVHTQADNRHGFSPRGTCLLDRDQKDTGI